MIIQSYGLRYGILETAVLPLKLIPATQLCLIGAFSDFLLVKILKGWHIYFDFQKIERHFHFLGQILPLSSIFITPGIILLAIVLCLVL